jgi:plasmid stabilization system protein ParE
MAEIVWTEPALADLDAIADYIALENPTAAAGLVQRIFRHVERLGEHPSLGPVVPELGHDRYRHLVEPPCRVFYRVDGDRVLVLHVLRGERLVRPELFAAPAAHAQDAGATKSRRRRGR